VTHSERRETVDEYYATARAVLESRDMLAPNGPLTVLRIPQLTTPATVYAFDAPSMFNPRSELLVLFARKPENSELDELVSKAQHHVGTNHVMCVGPGLDKYGRAGISTWSPEEFFRNLFCIPADLPAKLRDVASIERPTEFSLTYQGREAFVHSTPDGCGAGTHQPVDAYLKRWLRDRTRFNPVLLLGERGSGKSWQALRFAHDACSSNKLTPWQYGPALFVRLSDLVNLLDKASAATPVLCEYLFREYGGISSKFDRIRTCGSLLASGHTVICADGFDEMDVLPSDAAVRARFSSLLSLLTKKTRFLLTCRPGHFSSLSALLNMTAWPGTKVGEGFEVLELLPFDLDRKRSYLASAKSSSAHNVPPTVNLLGESADPLVKALSICTRYPGLLAQIVEAAEKGVTSTAQLIEQAVRRSYTEFNLQFARTFEDYQNPNGDIVDLSLQRREQLLAELAWYMTSRGLTSIDLKDLPLRFREAYGITDDALERDLRSQTVLEVVPPETQGDADDRVPERTSIVRFALRDETMPIESTDATVAGALYLARYLATHLTQPGPFGPLSPGVRLSFLGRVRLGPLTCALLKEYLRECAVTVENIGRDAWNLLVQLSKEGNARIFSRSFRYLADNLATLGALSPEDAQRVNPWMPSVLEVIRSPLALPNYEMALIPPCSNVKGAEPFLLGVHEITNAQYLRFLLDKGRGHEDSTIQGREWTVSRMTRAGAGKEGERSANYVLSNEYHLFFWLPPEGSREIIDSANVAEGISYQPLRRKLEHPVTYLSWYAAAAFCDWLSIGEGQSRHYKGELLCALEGVETNHAEGAAFGYRLPRKSEWFWAARGGYSGVQWPWQLFPYYLGPESMMADAVNQDALDEYNEAQRIMKKILLDTGKQSYRVLYDEPNELGVSGLIGNVREWCEDPIELTVGRLDSANQRLVLGSTGYLGLSTFDLRAGFEYSAPLYPRNTNPDVGFRIARSLQPGEVAVLRQRENEIAACVRRAEPPRPSATNR